MRICWRMGLTPAQGRSLTDDDRLDLLAWDAHRQALVEGLHEELAAPIDKEPDKDAPRNGMSFEILTLLKLAEWGM